VLFRNNLYFNTVTSNFCTSIAKFRRWAQRIGNHKLIFLDETHLRVSEAPRTTLVAPGESAYVVVDDDSKYAERYDMIAVTSGEKVFPPVIFSPEDREARLVDGIRGWMLNDYIEDLLARSISSCDYYPMYLIVDRSNIHNTSNMMDSLHNSGCFEVVDIKKMDTKTAKRISPLDNGMFHEWKEKCRKHSPLTKPNIISAMIQEWYNISQSNIKQYYRHCGLTISQDVFQDCPMRSTHNH
jgi:hypothetical protein